MKIRTRVHEARYLTPTSERILLRTEHGTHVTRAKARFVYKIDPEGIVGQRVDLDIDSTNFITNIKEVGHDHRVRGRRDRFAEG